MSTLRNEIILASAGTGKTFALSDRIVRLLSIGAAPESIVALTFTRKAAGEFASAVFRKLGEAALDPEVAAETARRLELASADCAQFQATLERMVAGMDRLAFGTLDSFFQRIVGTIPFDLGLAGPVAILDPHAAAEAREQTLRELVRPDPRRAKAQKALLNAFRDATWGVEEKQLLPRLLRFVETCHELYLAAPEAARWGQPGTVWPDGCRWLPSPQSIEDDVAAVMAWASATDGQFPKAVLKFGEAVLAWQPGGKIPDTAFPKRLIEIFTESSPTGGLEIAFGKGRQSLPEMLTPHFERIVRHLIGGAIGYALVSASGIHRILADFDLAYEETVRMTGRLGFSDVTQLLRRADSHSWQERLSGRLDHWLFDEFQDTDLAQWSVLENLVDEVLQDPTGGRSVFFVGDPKQAIYRWRGGEHRLLGRLAGKYGKSVEVRTLAKSYRSTRPVIDFVNAAGETIGLAAGLPADVREEWRGGWVKHASALDGPGHVIVRDAGDADAMADGFLEILRRVEPLERGMTCAILTRTNFEATSIAHALRARGFLDVAAEADVPVAIDNPVTRALLALFSAAAHPLDGGSRALVEMSPLGGWISSRGGWEGGRTWIFDRWTLDGAEHTVSAILADFDPPAMDDFSRRRIEQLLELARNFDQGNERSLDAFIRAATQNVRRDVASAGRVQVMTAHKSKGLGFDLVLLVVDDSTRIDSLPTGSLLLVGRDGAQQPQWIIRRVSETAADADETLSRVLQTERSEAAYEALCLLYVGITRAKQGLYVFVGDTPGEEGVSPNGIVRAAVAKLSPDAELPWEMGDAEWYRERKPVDREQIPIAPFTRPATWASRIRVEPLRPSRSEVSPSRVRRLDSTASRAGSSVHAAFGNLEWIDRATTAKWIWPDDRAREDVLRCLANPQIAEWFQTLAKTDSVWRERSFDAWLGEKWISGVFDRVILRRDGAILLDFKTDRDDPEASLERHRPQLDLYRGALAQLTGLPPSKISTFLVHVPSASALELD